MALSPQMAAAGEIRSFTELAALGLSSHSGVRRGVDDPGLFIDELCQPGARRTVDTAGV